MYTKMTTNDYKIDKCVVYYYNVILIILLIYPHGGILLRKLYTFTTYNNRNVECNI